MAIIPGALNLTFVSNYVGCHRICWRIQGDPTYDCSTEVNCDGNGASCNAVIGIQIDDSTCVPVIYEGYAQACCEDILSVAGRLPFTLSYTPSADCQGYTITCIGPVAVAAVIVTDPGSGYLPAGGTLPVTFAPSLGGVAATAYIGDGGVSDQFGSANPFPFGSLYMDGTYFNVPAINVLPLIGGSGALFTVVVIGGQVNSTVIVPGSNGTGYNPGDTITFNAANLGGSGSGVIVTISVINTGQIQNVILDNPGSGYTVQATATLPAPGIGTQALIGAAMAVCPPVDITTCALGIPIAVNVPLNVSFVACNSVPYVVPPEYTSVQTGCCNLCTTVTFDKDVSYTNPPATIYYIDCVTKALVEASIVAGGSVSACMVNDSWFVVESDPVNGTTNITVGPIC